MLRPEAAKQQAAHCMLRLTHTLQHTSAHPAHAMCSCCCLMCSWLLQRGRAAGKRTSHLFPCCAALTTKVSKSL